MSIAFVFPGQGSQSVGMMSALYQSFGIVRDTFGEASEILGFDLWRLVSDGPEDRLNQTDNTQPAMFVSSMACWRAWNESGGVDADIMAGHSLGEYTALCCAGVIDFADAVRLVTERGRLMQSAVPAGAGAMAAILGLDDHAVREVCEQAANGQVLQVANYNSPGQIVIAGDAKAIGRAIVLAKEVGAKRALKLSVSVPSHCDLMRPAAIALGAYMQNLDFSDAMIPVLSNISAARSQSAHAIKDALVKQLYSPVLWINVVNTLANHGIMHIVELGPGKVLTGLNKRIDKRFNAWAVFDPTTMEKAQEALSQAMMGNYEPTG